MAAPSPFSRSVTLTAMTKARATKTRVRATPVPRRNEEGDELPARRATPWKQEGNADPQDHGAGEGEGEPQVEPSEHLPAVHRLGQEEFVELPGPIQVDGPEEDPHHRYQEEDQAHQAQKDPGAVPDEPEQRLGRTKKNAP